MHCSLKYSIFKFEPCLFSVSCASASTGPDAGMPYLPKSLAAIRNSVAAVLRPKLQSGSLYSAEDVAHVLNVSADVRGNENIGIAVDVQLLIRAFAQESEDGVALLYDEYFGYHRDQNILFFHRERHCGANEGSHRSSAVIGRFSSVESARNANVVRWRYNIGEQVLDDLVECLKEESRPKPSKKKRSSVSPLRPLEPVDVSPLTDASPADGNSRDEPAKRQRSELQPPVFRPLPVQQPLQK